MFSPVSALLALLGFLLFAGCSGKGESQRPGVYRGGAFYGDAVRSEDVSR